MKAQVTYDLLKRIEENDGLYEEEVIRILKFINQDVYKTIDKLLEKYYADDTTYQVVEGVERDRKELEMFLDAPESSILAFLSEMINDNKTEFIERFFGVCNRYFKLIDNGLYDIEDFNPMTLTFNLYVMLKAYHEYKEDFGYFDNFINNFTFLINNGSLLDNEEYSGYSLFLKEKKDIIDHLIEMKAFTDYPAIKDFLVDMVKTVTEKKDADNEVLEEYEATLELIKNAVEGTKKYVGHPKYNEKAFNQVLGDIFKTFDDPESEYFYSPILSLGNRHEYIMEAYENYLDNGEYLDEVIGAIDQFDNSLFEYLDQVNGDGKDSFVSCMEMVFDSDCFFEMLNKLHRLLAATVSFQYKRVDEALLSVKEISTDSFKRVLFDKKITLGTDTVNKVDKPSLIVDRMCDAYERAFGEIAEDIDYTIRYSYNNESYMNDVESEVVEYVSRCVTEEKNRQEEEERSRKEQTRQEEVFAVVKEPQYVPVKKEENVGGFQKIKSMFGKK